MHIFVTSKPHHIPSVVRDEQLNSYNIMHIGHTIQQKLKDEGKTVVWLASELGCHRTNIYNLFEKYSIDTQTLQRISVIMRYNFFTNYTKETDIKITQSNQ